MRLFPLLLLLPGVALADLASFLASLQNAGLSLAQLEGTIIPQIFNWNQSVPDWLRRAGLNVNLGETEFLNLPGYANFSTQYDAWFLHIRGQAYQAPFNGQIQSGGTVLDQATDVFLLGDVDLADLTAPEKLNARNLTAAILALPVSDETLEFTVRQSGAANTFTWTRPTDQWGQVDGFVTLAGNFQEGPVQVHVSDVKDGNATSFLVPPTGTLVVSDIDDILRETKIWNPVEGLLNSFARPFRPWLNMPTIYAEWARNQDAHFHYLTTTPQQASRRYISFLNQYYPPGSFDSRPGNFSSFEQVYNSRRFLLNRVLETFPQRRFVLVGDTSNNDVLNEYPAAMKAFPDRVQCILIRDVQATEPGNRLPTDTSAFADLDPNKYMFFRTPDDLRGVDVMGTGCRNSNVPRTTEFGWRNVPGAAAGLEIRRWRAVLAVMVTAGMVLQ